jgi:hypothetical protein
MPPQDILRIGARSFSRCARQESCRGPRGSQRPRYRPRPSSVNRAEECSLGRGILGRFPHMERCTCLRRRLSPQRREWAHPPKLPSQGGTHSTQTKTRCAQAQIGGGPWRYRPHRRTSIVARYPCSLTMRSVVTRWQAKPRQTVNRSKRSKPSLGIAQRRARRCMHTLVAALNCVS